MNTDSKTNFMKTSELYLKITEQQRNALTNQEILSLIFSENRIHNKDYQNPDFQLSTR